MKALPLCGLMALVAIPAWAQDRSQQIEDARALLSQDWKTNLALIEAVASADKCGVVNKIVADKDFLILAADMHNEQAAAGLYGDTTMHLEPLVYASRAKGLDESSEAFCRDRWQSPADRAAFRRVAQGIFDSR